jgi:hypothetical protein
MGFQITWDIKKFFNVKSNSNVAIELALTQIWLMVQNQAKINAPYDKWTLRRSIITDFKQIKSWLVVVWSQVAYARRREFENYKNPHTKYYLKRWYEDNRDRILKIVIEQFKLKL